jgi:hypothetical protein
MKNVFDPKDVNEFIERINQLTPDSKALWGKMSVDQMLAHCNVSYEYVYTNKHKAPNPFMKLMINLFVKKHIINEVPYKKNGQTAPAFIITDSKEFEKEKTRLIDHILKTMELGENHFDGKVSLTFGKMDKRGWNNMFAKHLDHHLSQFGV